MLCPRRARCIARGGTCAPCCSLTDDKSNSDAVAREPAPPWRLTSWHVLAILTGLLWAPGIVIIAHMMIHGESAFAPTAPRGSSGGAGGSGDGASLHRVAPPVPASLNLPSSLPHDAPPLASPTP